MYTKKDGKNKLVGGFGAREMAQKQSPGSPRRGRPGLGSQSPHGGSEPSLTPASGDLAHSSEPSRYQASTCRKNTHMHKINKSIKKVKRRNNFFFSHTEYEEWEW